MNLPAFLTHPGLRLLLFGGKGGVGKTTCATAAALLLSRRAPSTPVRLFSTDPAHSLLDSLADAHPPAALHAVEFDAGAALEQFKRRYGATLEAIAERGTFLEGEDIRRFLSLSLPGMDELFGFLDIAHQAQQTGRSERTVVDTAPTGHTLRLLAMPELLSDWIEVLDTLLAKHRYMKSLFARAYQPDELDRFLDELSTSVRAAEELLRDPERCRFVPVMTAEELSVRETARLLEELARLKIPAGEIVVNMLAPEGCEICDDHRQEQLRVLAHLPSQYRGRALWSLPLQPGELRGVSLEDLWERVEALDLSAEGMRPKKAQSYARSEPSRVDAPAPPPPPETKLLFFAGKGGVGKTTFACATALRLARDRPDRTILLFSTDPAHSLADCLGQPVGARLTSIRGKLAALEIDAEAELESLKRQYRDEIDRFFGSLLGGLDVPYDREVMARLIDLSPPGLDEIMSLTRAMDLLASRRFDLLVFDSSPTGHLVRLLEMPQLIESWLKAFFEVFLKYREVLQMPEMSERLVGLSKSLHRFRALLRDRERSAVYVVSLPTRMALEETRDLVAACERIGVNVATLFLNLMTPETDCPFCAKRALHEREVEGDYAGALPIPRTRVYRQPDVRGLERLDQLGADLFETEEKGREADGAAPP